VSSTLVATSRPVIRRKLQSLLVIVSMLGLTLGVVTPVLAATTITLVSGAGNGAFETPDPNVTYAIPSIPASGAAVIVAPHGVYASISGARWINTTGNTGDDQASGRTTDYSIPFSLPAGFSAASITVQVLTDNAGTVLLNGVQIGQQPQVDTSSNFNTISSFTNNAQANFHAGSNTLTIGNLDFGSANAVDFRADVTYGETTTAPTANPTRTPAPNANGWSNTDVTVDWNWTDAGSGIDPAKCTTSSTTTGEFGAAGQTLTASCTNLAGATGTASLTIFNVDLTPPTITAAVTSAPDGANGWYISDVTVQFTCSDDGSGIPANACPADEILSTEGTAVESTARTVTDAAGNTSDPSNIVTVKLDTTGPELDASVDPNPVTLHGSAAATPGASDDVSGVVSQSCDAVDTSSVGAHTVACTATNGAGLITNANVPYQVNYRFDGFLQPINDTAHTLTCGSPCPASAFKGGSTVPVKFELRDADGLVVESATAPLWVTPRMVGPTGTAVDETVDREPATTDSTYRLDGSHYSHNWSTKGYATGFFWRIGVAFDDGQTYYVNIALM
jgi:hypothetical protein